MNDRKRGNGHFGVHTAFSMDLMTGRSVESNDVWMAYLLVCMADGKPSRSVRIGEYRSKAKAYAACEQFAGIPLEWEQMPASDHARVTDIADKVDALLASRRRK